MAEDIIRAIEATGVRRSETPVYVDGMDVEGRAVRLQVVAVRVRGGQLELVANPC